MIEGLKERWIDALYSGEYKQGHAYLCKGDEYCCLGVLFDIESDTDWLDVSEKHPCGLKTVWQAEGTDACDKTQGVAMPPNSFLRKIGLSLDDAAHLAELNDGGYSFNELAEEINNLT